MFTKEHTAFQYTDRIFVLRYLTRLMKKVLHPKERDLVYCHCGIGVDVPMGWQELASHCKFASPEIAEKCYYRAIEKTRAAIPGSELDELVAGYNPI